MTTENPSRRRILAGTAAAIAGTTALNVAAIATAGAAAQDPVFAAIEEHRRCYAVLVVAGKNEPDLEHPDHAAWEARSFKTMDEEDEAADALVATVPTTVAGLLAYLDYFVDFPDVEHRPFLMEIIETIAEASHNLIGGEVA